MGLELSVCFYCGAHYALSPCPLQGSDWVVLEQSEQSHVANHLDSTEAEVRICTYMYLLDTTNDNNALVVLGYETVCV